MYKLTWRIKVYFNNRTCRSAPALAMASSEKLLAVLSRLMSQQALDSPDVAQDDTWTPHPLLLATASARAFAIAVAEAIEMDSETMSTPAQPCPVLVPHVVK
jgi:hypothetical protein